MTGIGASPQALPKKPVAKPYMFHATVTTMSKDTGSGPRSRLTSFLLLKAYLLRALRQTSPTSGDHSGHRKLFGWLPLGPRASSW